MKRHALAVLGYLVANFCGAGAVPFRSLRVALCAGQLHEGGADVPARLELDAGARRDSVVRLHPLAILRARHQGAPSGAPGSLGRFSGATSHWPQRPSTACQTSGRGSPSKPGSASSSSPRPACCWVVPTRAQRRSDVHWRDAQPIGERWHSGPPSKAFLNVLCACPNRWS